MKDNKICFNKTLTYLILLVAAVVGAFYVMNYANNQKVTQNTEAAKNKCRTETGVSGIWRQSACPSGYTEYTGPGGSYTYGPGGANKMYCCLANFAAGGTNFGTKQEVQDAITAANCTGKKNIISEMLGLRCKYYTGNYTVTQGKVRCDIKVSDDFIACSPGVGKALKNKVDTVKATCTSLKGTVVAGTVELSPTTKHYVCMVYTGGYRTGTNPAAANVASGDYTSMCMINYARDYNVGTVASPLYNTNNCH